ncbi:MAG: hypothetical protein WC847_03645 [Candidatus Paceibacterota bacterium]|jgi:hypothetical protein
MGINIEQDLSGYVYVDRGDPPPYPYWVEGVDCPEYEKSGFMAYTLGSLGLYLHPKQKVLIFIKGIELYDYFKETRKNFPSRLSACLNLQDGHAIAKKGVETFNKFFRGKEVYLWKSVVFRKEIHKKRGVQYVFYVPFICVRGDKVVILWRWLKDYLIWSDPALCYRMNLEGTPSAEPLRLCLI